jgi:hypothetical protein
LSFSFHDHLSEWKAKQITLIRVHIQEFAKSLKEKDEKDFWKCLRAGATSSDTGGAVSTYVDCAYFYPSDFQWNKLNVTSNIVRIVALELWLEHQKDNDVNELDSLKQLLAARSVNVSVRGFIDEKIVLAVISQKTVAFTAKRQPVGGDELKLEVNVGKSQSFAGTWKNQKNDAGSTGKKVIDNLQQSLNELSADKPFMQFTPLVYNYPSVDTVLVAGSSEQKCVIAVQITYEKPSLKTKFGKTVEFFRSDHWKKFVFEPLDQWTKMILWVSPHSDMHDTSEVCQGVMTLKQLFELGNIEYA